MKKKKMDLRVLKTGRSIFFSLLFFLTILKVAIVAKKNKISISSYYLIVNIFYNFYFILFIRVCYQSAPHSSIRDETLLEQT